MENNCICVKIVILSFGLGVMYPKTNYGEYINKKNKLYPSYRYDLVLASQLSSVDYITSSENGCNPHFQEEVCSFGRYLLGTWFWCHARS